MVKEEEGKQQPAARTKEEEEAILSGILEEWNRKRP